MNYAKRAEEMAKETSFSKESCDSILTEAMAMADDYPRCDFCGLSKNLKSKVIDGEEKIICKACEDRDHRLHEKGRWITNEIIADTIFGHQLYGNIKRNCHANRICCEDME